MPYPAQKLITSSYIHKLSCVYQLITNRGLLIDVPRLQVVRDEVNNEIAKLLGELSSSWGRHVYLGSDYDDGSDTSINLNASSGKRSLVNSLKLLGFTVPVIRKRVSDGNSKWFEHSESANSESLYKIFGDTGDVNIQKILYIRHLNTLKTYKLDAELWNDTLFSSYNVSGPDTGRRGSRRHVFGLGDNVQNLPKHDRYGLGFYKKYRKCIIARPGKLFFSVDQCSAEEWPVYALAEDHGTLKELQEAADGIGFSRHAKLAALIYQQPVETISKDSNEYFIGKKGRHANHYKLQAKTFSSQCAANNVSLSEAAAKVVLDKVNRLCPQVQTVYHEYIRQCLYNTRMLVTPFGRERVFFGLKPNDQNFDIFTKAFAYIPQSTVGDNTGLAVFDLFKSSVEDSKYFNVVHECHDSITCELEDSLDTVIMAFIQFRRAFERKISFHNGIELQIPIEGELSYDFCDSVKIKSLTPDGVEDAYKRLQLLKEQQKYQVEKDSIAAVLAGV